MAKQFPPIVLDIEGLPKTFDSVEGLQPWLREEREAWKWLDHESSASGIERAWDLVADRFAELHRRLDAVVAADPAAAPGTFQSACSNLATRLREFYGNNQFLIATESERGKWLLALAAEDEPAALEALRFFLRIGDSRDTRPRPPLRGVAHALLFETGLPRALDGFRAKSESDFEALQNQNKKTLDELKAKYLETLAFKEPAKFWEAKSSGHRWMLGVLALATAIQFVAAGWWLKNLARTLLTDPPKAWQFVEIGTIATLCVWWLRIMVKFLVSQAHLASDANERRVLTKLYLSLVDEGKAFRRTDRQLILQALFRTTATGMVKDDEGGGPATIPEVILKLVGKT